MVVGYTRRREPRSVRQRRRRHGSVERHRACGGPLELLHSFAPDLYGRILPAAFEEGNYGRRPMAPTAGQVVAPAPGDRRVDGGWRRHGRRQLVGALLDALKGAARGILRG
jgi:hypothetical protein